MVLLQIQKIKYVWLVEHARCLCMRIMNIANMVEHFGSKFVSE